MNNLHVTLSLASKSVQVHVTAAKQSNSSLTIGGKAYSLSGDKEGIAWIKERINQVLTFKDMGSFKATLESIPPISGALQVLGIRLTDDRTALEKIQRGLEHAKTIGHGFTKAQFEGGRGRIIGHHYYREIFGSRHESTPFQQQKLLLWKEDSDNSLSFVDWEKAKMNEWRGCGTSLGFVEWVSNGDWKKSNTTDSFDLWELKRLWKRLKSDKPFLEWKKTDDAFREEERKENTPHLNFRDFNTLLNAAIASGTSLSLANFEKFQKWKQAGSPGLFAEWANQEDWKKSKSPLPFNDWMDKQESDLKKRWEGSGLKDAGMPFDVWRLQQDGTALVDINPFYRLNDHERKVYKVSFDQDEKGLSILTRNGRPYNTEHDKTLHSGNGNAIFVLSPSNDIYAASHIGGVFHHSSFLDDGAVIAAGEIKTDKNGHIIYLSSKSGHYKPGDQENLIMLRYFKDRGVDLSKVEFSCYTKQGESRTYRSAEKYLQKLEFKQNERRQLLVGISGQNLIHRGLQNPLYVVLNNMNKLYAGPSLYSAFEHIKINQIEIKRLEAKIKRLETHNAFLKDTQGLKRTRLSRAQMIKTNESHIQELQKKIDALQFTPGMEDICGGGLFTLNDQNEIVHIDFKIKDHPLDDKEVKRTLNALKQKGVDLSQISLTYYIEGKSVDLPNALEYLKSFK